MTFYFAGEDIVILSLRDFFLFFRKLNTTNKKRDYKKEDRQVLPLVIIYDESIC